MITYQDLILLGDDEQKRMGFVHRAINEHKSSEDYNIAALADLYDRHRNKTINDFKKWIYLVSGKKVEDSISANFKLGSNIFHRLAVNQNHFSLGNGVTFENEETKDRLGKDFDNKVRDGGMAAIVQGLAFGLFNLDHIEIFKLTEFVPLWDEEDGGLKAGIRFWQLADTKPLRAVLYEIDGYTSYIWRRRNKDGKPVKGNKGEILHEKQPYKKVVVSTPADGESIIAGENYASFPIVPYWANKLHQSEFVGLQEHIDCLDLIKSGFANTVDEASFIYWTLKNSNGMDDMDLTQFVDRIKTIHAAATDGDAVPNQIEAPHESREALLERLEKDIYKDWMAVNSEFLTSGNETATAIRCAYEPQNIKADDYEYCIIEFIEGILKLAGIKDTPTFSRSQVFNRSEEITTIVQAAQFTGDDYTREKILTMLGDGDRYQEITDQLEANGIEKITSDEADETEE